MSDAVERCVLLVDDSPADLTLMLRCLPRAGGDYRYVTARSAAEGLARVVDSTPQIVLLDFAMPDADGVDFLEDLQAMTNPDAVEPVVVMVTGQSDPRIAAVLMRMGAADYIAKSDLTRERMDAVLFEARRVIEHREAALRRGRMPRA